MSHTNSQKSSQELCYPWLVRTQNIFHISSHNFTHPLVLFGGGGVLAYLAFGSEVQTVVITNLNSESKLVQAVQFLYSLAILLSVPLQLFPAVRIMENGLFSRSGKGNPKVKWQKNILRFVTVMVCALISWAGASDLDKFVALVGSFAW